MKLSRLKDLLRINLRRDRKGALLSIFGVAVGIGALCFFIAMGLGIGQTLRTKVFPTDARLVEVVPPTISVSLFGGVRLDDAAVKRLSELPGVARAHRKMQLRVPAISRYDGSFFGQRLRMGLEILAEGVDPGLLQEDLAEGRRFVDPPEGEPLPVVISPRLLEIYNKSFARNRGLPALSPAMLGGFQFPVSYGRSYVTHAAAAGEQIRGEAVLVGLSDRAMLQGITMPLQSVKRLNQRFGADAESYSALVLVAETPDAVPGIVQAVKELGFDIDDTEARLAERVGAAVGFTTGAMALLSLLICGLAGVNIALTLGASVRAREKEIGILRAVGARSRDVSALVVSEALVIGLVGGGVGAIGARLLAFGVDALAAAFLPDFPFRPESFFHFPLLLPLLGVALGALASLLGALPPARRAARMDPARSIGA